MAKILLGSFSLLGEVGIWTDIVSCAGSGYGKGYWAIYSVLAEMSTRTSGTKFYVKTTVCTGVLYPRIFRMFSEKLFENSTGSTYQWNFHRRGLRVMCNV
jgi:hypothetical protein